MYLESCLGLRTGTNPFLPNVLFVLTPARLVTGLCGRREPLKDSSPGSLPGLTSILVFFKLSGDDRKHLEHMVLTHVPEGSDFFIRGAAVIDPFCLEETHMTALDAFF